MKTIKQIKNRIATLSANNNLVTNEKGHELNQVRIDELVLILNTNEYNLRGKFEELKRLNKVKRNSEINSKIAQIEWVLKSDGFTRLEGGKI